MQRIGLAVVASLVSIISVPAAAQPPDPSRHLLPHTRAGVFATVHGRALTATSTPVANAPVRLRDTRRGRIVAQMITDQFGSFSFEGIDPGSYVGELVGRDGWVLAASEMISVGAGETQTIQIKLPGLKPEGAGMLGPRGAAAASVLAAAAASGVLARTTTGQPISPR